MAFYNAISIVIIWALGNVMSLLTAGELLTVILIGVTGNARLSQ